MRRNPSIIADFGRRRSGWISHWPSALHSLVQSGKKTMTNNPDAIDDATEVYGEQQPYSEVRYHVGIGFFALVSAAGLLNDAIGYACDNEIDIRKYSDCLRKALKATEEAHVEFQDIDDPLPKPPIHSGESGT